MALRKEHELHKRRLGRNVGLGVALLAFVALIYLLTVAKTWDKYQPERPADVTSESN